MKEFLYCIENQYGTVIAKDMTIEVVMILARALFDHYFGEEGIAFTIKKQETEAKLDTLSDEEYDKTFKYHNAERAKLGTKGYFANTLQALKSLIDGDSQPSKLTEILGEECTTRFMNEDGFLYELFYPIEE